MILKLNLRNRPLAILAFAALGVVSVMAQNALPVSSPLDGKSQVVPSLQGLVFLAKPEAVVAAGVVAPGVNSSAVQFLGRDFTGRMTAYLGHPLTFDGLNEITHAVVAYYRVHNHPLVDAIAPAQNVDSGVIQIVVTEFRVGSVRTQGNKWFSDNVVAAPITLQHGDAVDSQLLINELDAANANPFRRVNLVYQPGADPGYTDLVLQTQDRLPVRVFAGFDNNGTPVTGRNRWEMGVTWGNALWHDQQLSYQFSASPNYFTGGGSFVGHSLTWSMPVRGRDSLLVFGSYERSVPNIGQDFGMIGHSGQASIRYKWAFHRTSSFIHSLQFGYDFKITNNNLAFGGAQVSRTNTEVDQFPVAYLASLTDKRGSTAFSSTLYYSPGDITGGNTNAAFQPANGQSGRPFANVRYLYWRTDATRLTKLPEGMTWASRAVAQASTSNLLYTEQLAAGGPDILRGYDPNSILGDEGIILSNELRSPAFNDGGERTWLGQLQFIGFWDYGHLDSVHNVPGDINHLNASSVGMGVRYNVRSNMAARCDYGWQLQHLPNSSSLDQLVSFGVIASY